jgi:thymidylate kinase
VRADEIVDAALRGRAVVVGSLPPAGRDLDVLLAAAEIPAVERALRAAGFVADGGRWLRFANLTAELVELVPAGASGLGRAQRRELLEEALTLPGARRLGRPAPHHVLLLLARGARGQDGLPEHRRRRLDAAVAEAPGALTEARARARAWGVDEDLRALWREAGGAPRHPLHAGLRARLGAARDLLRGRRRGAVIALSGIDGAGKSTQAAALADALERLGFDVVVQWTRLGFNDRFWDRAVRAKRVINRMLDRRPSARPEVPATVDRVAALRRRSTVLTELWAIAMTLENACAQRRAVGAQLARGRVVVCDRHTLDSVVSLRSLLGHDRSFGLQRALLQALTRRPLRAFLLDAEAETAWARKGELGLQRLRRHREHYLAEHRRLGVVRLDAAAPPAELAARIAEDCWRALRLRDANRLTAAGSPHAPVGILNFKE